jgi:ComF family protein
MIHRLKYRNQLILAEPIGKLLGNTLTKKLVDFHPDLIIPVPLHITRLRQRSYNQALEIARPLAHQSGIPLDTATLLRIRATSPQQGLSAEDRRKNLRQAFKVSSSIAGKRVLLIDDVLTTGETARACSKALVAAGANEIRVVVFGRA